MCIFQRSSPKLLHDIRLLKDFVHAERIIGRYFEAAVRQVTLEVPKGASRKNAISSVI